jgi:ubiquinone/menaquinone biosynthesis C-methylase UbiE
VLLDVPCGTGRFTARLSARGTRYLGADVSPAMLAEARAEHGGACFAAADLARLPFADRSVDVAVCVRLLHLVREPKLRLAFLCELARVARHGVVLEVRQAEALRPLLRRARARLGLLPRPPANLARAALAAELAAAGLALVARFPVRRPSWLSDRVLVAAR